MQKRLAVGAKEGGQIIGVGLTKFRELLAKGDIPHFKIGKKVLIRVEDLELFVKKQVGAA